MALAAMAYDGSCVIVKFPDSGLEFPCQVSYLTLENVEEPSLLALRALYENLGQKMANLDEKRMTLINQRLDVQKQISALESKEVQTLLTTIKMTMSTSQMRELRDQLVKML